MSVIIAGSPVNVGDRVFSRRAGTTGTITSVTGTTANATFTIGNEARTYVITNGGFVSGMRDIFWHEPLTLDLPKDQVAKAAKIQTVVDAVVAAF